MAKEKTLLTCNPLIFRNAPILSVLLFWMYPLFWLIAKNTTLQVTSLRTVLRKGIFSKNTTEVWHRDVQISQTFTNRIFVVGRIGISSAGQSGVEIDMRGVANPNKIKKIIDQHRIEEA